MSKYTDDLNIVNDWVDITNYHWHRLEGVMFNDSEFWDHTLHAMRDRDWWAWCDTAAALKIQHQQEWRRYPSLDRDTDEIQRRLMLGKPVVKPRAKGWNHAAFRLLMNIKDFVNDVRGTPTQQYSRPKAQPLEQQTAFERLFEFHDE